MRFIWTTAAAVPALAALSLLFSNASAVRAADEQAWPEPSAQAVWSYLQQRDYQNNWALWPGTSELYQGTQPHGMLLTTYVNRTAGDSLSGPVDEMPRGSIIVKENYKPTEELAAVTVMYKAPEGYNPEHNDWFWLKRLADGTVAEQQAASRVTVSATTTICARQYPRRDCRVAAGGWGSPCVPADPSWCARTTGCSCW